MSHEDRRPFEPLGLVARWRVIYELLQVTEIGEVLTYKVMAEALGLDPARDRRIIQGAIPRAQQELETVDKRHIEAVANVGYRVVEPKMQLELAKQRGRRAGKQLEHGKSHITNVDFNKIDPQLRSAFEVVGYVFTKQLEFMGRLELKQKRTEAALAAVKQQVETDMAAVDERLRWLEEQAAKRTSGD
jgi:hypothetical protein